MKNPFKRHKKSADPIPEEPVAIPAPEEEPVPQPEPDPPAEIDDGFTEWCRSQIRGGIERRERNDIFEAYSVYGADAAGNLTCRYYHRYPEHERDFDLSYTRALSFEQFNRRLLGELDKCDLKLADYADCIRKAAALSDKPLPVGDADGLSDDEFAALQDFCESMDTLKDQSYLHGDGVFRCECESVVGGESLNLRFRKPLTYDALTNGADGVRMEEIGGYDIDDMWVMGVYNRLRERCTACKVIRLTSEWSLDKESVWLIRAAGFPGIGGDLLTAVAPSEQFRRFGFYSLDFSNK